MLLVLLAGIALRLWPSLGVLFLGTFLVGLAVAIANVAFTTLIKNDFPQHIALLSGLHSTMLVGGGALAAGLTLPILSSWPRCSSRCRGNGRRRPSRSDAVGALAAGSSAWTLLGRGGRTVDRIDSR